MPEHACGGVLDPIAHDSIKTQVAKRVAPAMSTATSRLGLTATADRATLFLSFLLGWGSGSGWDDGEARLAAEHLAGIEAPVVVDCGANAGQWTTALRERLGHARGRWLLVEPTAEYHERLRAIPNTELIAAAAGDVVGPADFFVPTEPSGWMTLHERRDSFSQTKRFRRRTVQVVRLEDQLRDRGIDRIDYLKMDIEGHELFALQGLGDYLHEGRISTLTFEFGAANVNSRTFFRDLWDLLTPRGFAISRIAPGGVQVPVAHYYETLEYFRGATNYLATLTR